MIQICVRLSMDVTGDGRLQGDDCGARQAGVGHSALLSIY